MTRFVIPFILIAIAIAVFFVFTDPIYTEISLLRDQAGSYDQALNNSKALENERDKLTEKYNLIGGENLTRLQKMLPENVDNIRLILEIEQIAAPYGMVLKDVSYENAAAADSSDPNVITGGETAYVSPDYGVWDLQFTTSGSYTNFINFIKDLERNLRIVDIASVEFSSDASVSGSDNYEYMFTIKTYWLKN